MASERRTQNASSGTQNALFQNATSERSQIARVMSKRPQNATSERNFGTQLFQSTNVRRNAALSEGSERKGSEWSSGSRQGALQLKRVCASGFGTQWERSRNATRTQQFLDIGPIAQKASRHSKTRLTPPYRRLLADLAKMSERNPRTQQKCEPFTGTQLQNATSERNPKVHLANRARVFTFCNTTIVF